MCCYSRSRGSPLFPPWPGRYGCFDQNLGTLRGRFGWTAGRAKRCRIVWRRVQHVWNVVRSSLGFIRPPIKQESELFRANFELLNEFSRLKSDRLDMPKKYIFRRSLGASRLQQRRLCGSPVNGGNLGSWRMSYDPRRQVCCWRPKIASLGVEIPPRDASFHIFMLDSSFVHYWISLPLADWPQICASL